MLFIPRNLVNGCKQEFIISTIQRLNKKVIVIAGGAGGIGSETAQRLASEGASLVLGDINHQNALAVAKTIIANGGQAVATHLDIGEESSVKQLIDLAITHFGRLDGLHANAADLRVQDQDTNAVEIDLDIWQHLININLTGYLYCTRFAVPEMLKNGGGALVYTSSDASFYGEALRVAYACSKAGVNALMRHTARKWGEQGIRANAIAPGLVRTPMVNSLPKEFLDATFEATPSLRLGKPADIAAMVAHLMSGDGEWINGQVISVNGGGLMR